MTTPMFVPEMAVFADNARKLDEVLHELVLDEDETRVAVWLSTWDEATVDVLAGLLLRLRRLPP